MTELHVTRIVVTGSESTGKSTLARELATHFGAIWVAEQSRLYAARARRALTAEDVAPIASEQIAAEDAALAEARRRLGSLYLLSDIDIPWTPDPVRDRPHSRDALHAEFRNALAEFGARS